MNMMTLQERREEQAVPEFVRDLRSEFENEGIPVPETGPFAAAAATKGHENR